MTMEKATSSTSREVESQVRPTMPPDLFQAALKGNGQVLVALLRLPAQEQNHITVTVEEPNTHQIEENFESATAFGDTVLHILVANNHNDLAMKVFQKDASLLKARNKKLETPLHRAARVGNADIISSLIQLAPTAMKDAVEETNIDGDTALHLVAKHGHPNVGDNLLTFNLALVYKVNNEGLSPLHIAIVENKSSMIELILEFDSSLASAQFSNGMFPVHVAASMGNTRLILFLLENFPDYANLQDQNGRNFFHLGADENIKNIFTTRELTEKGAWMLKVKDYDGNTPLHIAARKGNGLIMKSICESLTFDAPDQNNEGQTAFDISEIQVGNTAEDFKSKFRKQVYVSGRKFTPHWFKWLMEGPSKYKGEQVQLIGLGSVLITTVSFAAAFTFPGGYDGSNASRYMMLAFGTGSYVMLAPVSMPIAIIILVLALVAGSPLGNFLYGSVQGLIQGAPNLTYYYNILGFYALPLLFVFCLAFLK